MGELLVMLHTVNQRMKSSDTIEYYKQPGNFSFFIRFCSSLSTRAVDFATTNRNGQLHLTRAHHSPLHQASIGDSLYNQLFAILSHLPYLFAYLFALAAQIVAKTTTEKSNNSSIRSVKEKKKKLCNQYNFLHSFVLIC